MSNHILPPVAWRPVYTSPFGKVSNKGDIAYMKAGFSAAGFHLVLTNLKNTWSSTLAGENFVAALENKFGIENVSTQGFLDALSLDNASLQASSRSEPLEFAEDPDNPLSGISLKWLVELNPWPKVKQIEVTKNIISSLFFGLNEMTQATEELANKYNKLVEDSRPPFQWETRLMQIGSHLVGSTELIGKTGVGEEAAGDLEIVPLPIMADSLITTLEEQRISKSDHEWLNLTLGTPAQRTQNNDEAEVNDKSLHRRLSSFTSKRPAPDLEYPAATLTMAFEEPLDDDTPMFVKRRKKKRPAFR